MTSQQWNKKKLSEIVDRLDAGVSVNSSETHPKNKEPAILKTSSITGGRFNSLESKIINFTDLNRAKINPRRDRIILSRMNTPALVGASAYVDRDYSYLFLPDRLWQLEPIDEKVQSMRWLAYVLGSPLYLRIIKNLATGTSGSMKNISKEGLLSINIPFPPLLEQKAIADILSTWDEAIEKTERLIELKEKHFQSQVCERIFNSTYSRIYLKKAIYEITERNDSGFSRVLSVTNSKGFILPEEQFKHRVASSNLENYKVVRKGQFAYNPSRINVGSIARLDRWDLGILSPMYVVFGVNNQLLNSDFLHHWLQTGEAKKRISRATQGSVRESVSFGDFSSLLIPLPEMTVQEVIVSELTTFSREINILKRIKDVLVHQKRGLMQKLLTGKWRVKIKEENHNEQL